MDYHSQPRSKLARKSGPTLSISAETGLGLWDRGEERGPPVHLGGRAMLTAWLNRVAPAPAGDPTTLAQGPTGWQIPGGADVSGDAANEIAMRRVAVQVSAVQ